MEYTKYFEEYIPIKKEDIPSQGLKHKYRVVIHRALFNEDAFNLYKIYQEKVHNDAEKATKEGFCRFLCESPLYDPNDKSESHVKPDFESQETNDKDREFKDEGVYPQFCGSYHMYHYLDVN